MRISYAVRERAAELYLQSPEAQHGDEDIARWDADLWAELFRQAEYDVNEPEDA